MTMQTPLSRDTDPATSGPATDAARTHRRVGSRGVGSLSRTEGMYYLFLVPALVLFTAFVVAPACVGVFYSFTDYLGFGQWDFIGVENYKALVSDPAILASYGFTLASRPSPSSSRRSSRCPWRSRWRRRSGSPPGCGRCSSSRW